MRRTKIYLVTAAALLALAGCDRALEPAGGAITIEASVGPMTKVTYDGAGSAFAAGDQLALYAWTGTATEIPARRAVDGVVNTFDGTKWTPASLMRWQTMSTPHFFLGVSPAPGAAVADLTAVPYTLDPSPDKYAASDLLLATNFGTDGAGVKPSQTAVPLAFDHAMAKLVVNLKFRSQWAAVPAVSALTVTAKSAATVNYLTKSVTASGTAAPLALPAAAAEADKRRQLLAFLQQTPSVKIPHLRISWVFTERVGNQFRCFVHWRDIVEIGVHGLFADLRLSRRLVQTLSAGHEHFFKNRMPGNFRHRLATNLPNGLDRSYRSCLDNFFFI